MLNDLLQTKAKAEEIAKKIQAIFPRQKDNRSSKNDSENEKQELEAQKYKYSTKPNNMYAIYGGWGTGKTRLLEELEDIIITDYRVVWFRPWEYFEESQNIDNKLLSEILEQDKIWKWLNLGGIIFIIMTIFTIGNMQWFQANLWQNFIALNLNDYFVVIGVFVIILLILYKFNIIQFISNLGIGSISFDIAKLYSNLRDYTESSKDIQEKISSKVNTKTIVFVDDLDRCRKETVVEVLEHIKHFYASDKLFFIFAIDRKSLATYIAEHYNYQKETGEIDIDRGYQYLDKLFPEYYNLRYLDGRELFNEYLKKQEIYDHLTATDRENYYLLIEYYASFNWRKVKALIDKFADIYKKIGYAKVVEVDDNKFIYLDQIFRWCLLHEFYPEIFEKRNWRKVVVEKFYDNSEYKQDNLFRTNPFSDDNRNIYFQAIEDKKINKTFYLEKLYNYNNKFDKNNIESIRLPFDYELHTGDKLDRFLLSKIHGEGIKMFVSPQEKMKEYYLFTDSNLENILKTSMGLGDIKKRDEDFGDIKNGIPNPNTGTVKIAKMKP
jgi:hypothetical protein